jgi:hypothetical protein
MKKLYHVVLSKPVETHVGPGRWRNSLPYVYVTKGGPNFNNDDIAKTGEFFEIEDVAEDGDLLLRVLAEHNPGCEIRVYTLEQVGQCPAAPMVVKKVTADGILPV